MANFKKREKARRYAMQALYGWAVTGNDLTVVEAHYLADRNPKKFDVEYFSRLIHEVPAKIQELDQIFAEFTENLKVEELNLVELTILRLASYEMVHVIEIPYKVIINEALELAKMFGAAESFKFVNGVLDKIAKKYRIQEL